MLHDVESRLSTHSFQGREIDGKKVCGAYIFTEHGSEGVTIGVTNVLYPYGFKYDYHMQGFVNSADAIKGLEFSVQVLHGAGPHQRLHVRRPRCVQVGANP